MKLWILLFLVGHGDGHKTDAQAQKSLKEASRKSQRVFALSVNVLHASRKRVSRDLDQDSSTRKTKSLGKL